MNPFANQLVVALQKTVIQKAAQIDQLMAALNTKTDECNRAIADRHQARIDRDEAIKMLYRSRQSPAAPPPLRAKFSVPPTSEEYQFEHLRLRALLRQSNEERNRWQIKFNNLLVRLKATVTSHES